MGLGAAQRVSYTGVHDALTTLKYHGKGWPSGVTDELHDRVEREAVERVLLFPCSSASY